MCLRICGDICIDIAKYHLGRFQGSLWRPISPWSNALILQPLCSMLALGTGEYIVEKDLGRVYQGRLYHWQQNTQTATTKTDNGSKQTCCLMSRIHTTWSLCLPTSIFYVFLTSLLNLLQYSFCSIFWLWGHEACEILTPQNRDPACTPCTRRWGLNHWTARKVLAFGF